MIWRRSGFTCFVSPWSWCKTYGIRCLQLYRSFSVSLLRNQLPHQYVSKYDAILPRDVFLLAAIPLLYPILLFFPHVSTILLFRSQSVYGDLGHQAFNFQQINKINGIALFFYTARFCVHVTTHFIFNFDEWVSRYGSGFKSDSNSKYSTSLDYGTATQIMLKTLIHYIYWSYWQGKVPLFLFSYS